METLQPKVCPRGSCEHLHPGNDLQRRVCNPWREICQALLSSSRKDRNQGQLCQRRSSSGPPHLPGPCLRPMTQHTPPEAAQGGPPSPRAPRTSSRSVRALGLSRYFSRARQAEMRSGLSSILRGRGGLSQPPGFPLLSTSGWGTQTEPRSPPRTHPILPGPT